MSEIDHIDSIINGTADRSLVYELAFKAISSVADVIVESTSTSIETMSKQEARACSDRIELAIADLRLDARVFSEYPDIQRAIEAHLKVMSYAESALLPLFSLGNRDMARKTGAKKKTYLIKSEGTGLVKIGRTSDMEYRLKTLQNSAGDGISVLSVLDCDVESQMHRKFKKFRRHGEWFDDSTGAILREFRSMEVRP